MRVEVGIAGGIVYSGIQSVIVLPSVGHGVAVGVGGCDEKLIASDVYDGRAVGIAVERARNTVEIERRMGERVAAGIDAGRAGLQMEVVVGGIHERWVGGIATDDGGIVGVASNRRGIGPDNGVAGRAQVYAATSIVRGVVVQDAVVEIGLIHRTAAAVRVVAVEDAVVQLPIIHGATTGPRSVGNENTVLHHIIVKCFRAPILTRVVADEGAV